VYGLVIGWIPAVCETLRSLSDGIDAWAIRTAVPLALYMLASGMDDLFVALVMAVRWLRAQGRPRAEPDLHAKPEKRIAILLPLWREADVITGMVEHNHAAIDYSSYEIFAGVYPNAPPTLHALQTLQARFARIHISVCPHPGPTSKADCLNWIYQGLLLYEEEHGVRFEILVTQDDADLIHPLSLRYLNHYCDDYDMVQVPVLALPTPWWELTHGIYCDEFAEFQLKDMRARQALGSFIPSNGVGTGYRREALERLAETRSNRIFEPGCLTEDYENGLRLAEIGCRQFFVPVTFRGGAPVATREYFPRTFRSAVRQRTRWVTGNALQAWERHGWRGGIRFVYWLWRDRKGLIGNTVTMLTNLFFFYGAATWVLSAAGIRPWGLRGLVAAPWLLITAVLQIIGLAVRSACVARIYGWRYATGVPLRSLWANGINSLATLGAIGKYSLARLRRRPLVWVKTEHAYPSRETLLSHKRTLEELLIAEGLVSPEDVAEAREREGAGLRWTEWLGEEGRLDEDSLYEVMSLQQCLPLFRAESEEVRRKVARCLPARVLEEWGVLPVRIEDGEILLASPVAPPEELGPKLRRFTRLYPRFVLLPRSRFERLKRELL
jgi:adsorption protein B